MFDDQNAGSQNQGNPMAGAMGAGMGGMPQQQGGGAMMGGGVPPVTPAQASPVDPLAYMFGDVADKLFAENPPDIPVPEHPSTVFDEKYFLRCLAGSISLLKEEKWKIIDSVPKLSQFQVDELIKILEEEKTKFAELSKEHGDQLKKLEEQHLNEFLEIITMMEEDDQEDQATNQADEIRKNLGI